MSKSMSLPTEVWHLSWQYASLPDLTALAASCRLFRDICQPFLFSDITFTNRPMAMFGDRAKVHDMIMEGLIRTRERLIGITSSPHLAAMVSKCRFEAVLAATVPVFTTTPLNRGDPRANEISNETLVIDRLFNETIGAFVNLKWLCLDRFQLAADFCVRLQALPCLNSLYLGDCDVLCSPGPGGGGGVAVKEFAIDTEDLEWHAHLPENYHIISPAKLERLTMRERVSSRALLSVFTSAAAPLAHLVTLTLALDHDARELFYDFLEYCPELVSLDLDVPPAFASGVVIPQTSIPLLQQFRGPSDMVAMIVPGRPIKKLRIDNPMPDEEERLMDEESPLDKEVMEHTLLQASKSAASIVDLDLPFVPLNTSVMRLVLELFPKLKRLVFFLRNHPRDPEDDDSDSVGAEIQSMMEGMEPIDDSESLDGSADGEDEELVGPFNMQPEIFPPIIPFGPGATPGPFNMQPHVGPHILPFGPGATLGPFSMQQPHDFPPMDPFGLGAAGVGGLNFDMINPQDQDVLERVHQAMYAAKEREMQEDEEDDSFEHESEYSDASDTVDDAPVQTCEDKELDSYDHFLNSLADGSVSLPRRLRRLEIGQIPLYMNEKNTPDAVISEVVEKLGKLYPKLGTFVAGKMPRAWIKQRDGSWKAPKPERMRCCGPGAELWLNSELMPH